jgi:hypothetical protein
MMEEPLVARSTPLELDARLVKSRELRETTTKTLRAPGVQPQSTPLLSGSNYSVSSGTKDAPDGVRLVYPSHDHLRGWADFGASRTEKIMSVRRLRLRLRFHGTKVINGGANDSLLLVSTWSGDGEYADSHGAGMCPGLGGDQIIGSSEEESEGHGSFTNWAYSASCG